MHPGPEPNSTIWLSDEVKSNIALQVFLNQNFSQALLGIMLIVDKIKRELRRARNRRHSRVERREDAMRARNYDLQRAELTTLYEGNLDHGKKKLAIFLIYQPTGIAKSVYRTCEYLNSQGYSVMLVSNGSVEIPEREILLETCAFLLERPNFGHDFGG